MSCKISQKHSHINCPPNPIENIQKVHLHISWEDKEYKRKSKISSCIHNFFKENTFANKVAIHSSLKIH